MCMQKFKFCSTASFTRIQTAQTLGYVLGAWPCASILRHKHLMEQHRSINSMILYWEAVQSIWWLSEEYFLIVMCVNSVSLLFNKSSIQKKKRWKNYGLTSTAHHQMTVATTFMSRTTHCVQNVTWDTAICRHTCITLACHTPLITLERGTSCSSAVSTMKPECRSDHGSYSGRLTFGPKHNTQETAQLI